MSGKVRGAILAVLVIIVLALTPFRPLKVDGHSMEPTLHNGDTYVLDHLYWKPAGLRRNDIVAVRHGGEVWVKRLIGMPGDNLQLEYEGEWIIGIENLTTHPEARQADGIRVAQVPAGAIYVIGDNLNRSADSTTQEAGSFRLEDVIGVVRTFTLRRDFPFRHHL